MLSTLLLLAACTNAGTPPTAPLSTVPSDTASTPHADVLSVQVSGAPGSYSFAVELNSGDTGCESYADWWEVLDASGNLLYRRVLTHSHVDEQPFVRSGGPVDIQADTPVWVRGHRNPEGYVGQVFSGTVADGFSAGTLESAAPDLDQVAPLPDGCAF